MDDKSEPRDVPEPQRDQTRGGGPSWLLWIVLLLLVVYPLSLGPAAKLHLAHPAARPAIEGVYKPLTTLIDFNPHVRDFFVWYVEKVWKYDPPGSRASNTRTNSAAVSGTNATAASGK
jgi:hypothetical protein